MNSSERVKVLDNNLFHKSHLILERLIEPRLLIFPTPQIWHDESKLLQIKVVLRGVLRKDSKNVKPRSLLDLYLACYKLGIFDVSTILGEPQPST